MPISLPTRRARRRRLALTPLIDVVFLLLVFFIFAGRFEQYNHLTLEERRSGVTAPSTTRPILLRLLADGTARLGTATLTFEEVEGHIGDSHDLPLVLAPERDVDVQLLVLWVDQLREIGVEKISFMGSVAK